MQIGSIQKALNIKDKEEQYKKIGKVFENIESIDIIDLIIAKEELFKDKEEIEELLNYINIIFFEKAKINSKYVECMKIVEDTKDRLNKNNNYDMTIDHFIYTVWEEVNGKHYRS